MAGLQLAVTDLNSRTRQLINKLQPVDQSVSQPVNCNSKNLLLFKNDENRFYLLKKFSSNIFNVGLSKKS
jgi:hypothetical protein